MVPRNGQPYTHLNWNRQKGDRLMETQAVISFTGSKLGITPEQDIALDFLLSISKGCILRHGGCKGADERAHALGLKYELNIEVFPSNIERWQGDYGGATVVHPPAPPLERNHTIVDSSEILLATPRKVDEVLRSGTWATIRYAAQDKHRKIGIIRPDGIVVVGFETKFNFGRK